MSDPLLSGHGGVQRWPLLRPALTHAFTAVLAMGVASSLPAGANFILFRWWPRVADDANLLLASEIAVAGILLLLFNIGRMAWENRHRACVADAAALVYARQKRGHIERWRERRILKRLPAARDACILTLTGFHTFGDPASPLHGALAKAYEIRVMLLNPASESAQRRVDSLPDGITLRSFAMEIDASIAYLANLRALGRKVTVKFYEREPFWKVAVLGDHVWVQYCHGGFEVKHEPEYVFALNRASPRRGFFVPFYMHFLDQWNDASHPEFDFDTNELVYPDAGGGEARRQAFVGTAALPEAAPLSPPRTAWEYRR